jgi:NADH:ubiquinone oxidoreductase subunit 5 (subunit L)/multisubunit Na+/H+ antiporter MnhA subunit
LSNFIGEYLVMQGAAQANFNWVIVAATGPILSACYMLWLYQRVFFGKPSESVTHHISDLTGREWAIIAPLLALMFWLGSFTQTFMPAITNQNAAILHGTQPSVVAQRSIDREAAALGFVGRRHALPLSLEPRPAGAVSAEVHTAIPPPNPDRQGGDLPKISLTGLPKGAR